MAPAIANSRRDSLSAGVCCLLGGLILFAGLAPLALAQPPAKRKVQLPAPADAPAVIRAVPSTARKPADFTSAHFVLHTDLVSKDAHELMNRLESMLALIAKYWGHAPVGMIECYVVQDLKNWPEGSLDPAGRAKIAQGAGITMVDSLTLDGKPVAAKATVFATSDRGTPQHESVHAYCGQAFGRTGSLWYSEGMAEMGQYWRQGDTSVHCDPIVIEYLRSSRTKPLAEILGEDGVPRPGRPSASTGDSWQNYAWRWALCHLLENNPNYTTRFRALGLGFLNNQPVSFAEAYGAMLEEIAFEYRFFVHHVDQGYRVDLCSWDWKRKFRKPTDGSSLASRVAANRGWQPSGVIVSPDRKYDYSASGTWQIAKDGPQLTADGQPAGVGRLEGVILQDFKLSDPFPLGAFGSFTPPSEGRLYLRCSDAWNELAENRGAVTVKIKRAGAGPALPRPSRTADEPSETTAKSE